jgi:hypothetical protein
MTWDVDRPRCFVQGDPRLAVMIRCFSLTDGSSRADRSLLVDHLFELRLELGGVAGVPTCQSLKKATEEP